MLNISDNLKVLRKKHNYTIQTVADGIGIAVRTYQNYEYGQREISAEALYKLADFYNISVDSLLGRETKEQTAVEDLAAEFNLSSLEQKILDNYLALPDNMRSDLMNFLDQSVRDVINEDS